MTVKPVSLARRCTTDLLEYLRFFKGNKVIATEVAYNACKSDVLTSSGKTVSEYEVKISKADFKKDFTKTLGHKRYKRSVLKHESYNDAEGKTFAPHYFWFVVPEKFVEFVSEWLEDYPDYGIMSWDIDGEAFKGRRKSFNTKITVIKKAKLLSKKTRPKASMETVTKKIMHRATSELVINRMKEF